MSSVRIRTNVRPTFPNLVKQNKFTIGNNVRNCRDCVGSGRGDHWWLLYYFLSFLAHFCPLLIAAVVSQLFCFFLHACLPQGVIFNFIWIKIWSLQFLLYQGISIYLSVGLEFCNAKSDQINKSSFLSSLTDLTMFDCLNQPNKLIKIKINA